MDTKSESIQEEQATLYELIQVKDKIRDAIQQFQLLDRMCNRAKEEEEVVGERLVGLQKEFPALINARLGETDVGVIEAEETVLANLMGVNDELLLCIENYQRMVRSDESGLPLRRNCTRANDTSTGTGNRPVNSYYVSNALESVTEVTQSATNGIYSAGPSTSSEAQITAQFATMTMQDSPADDVRVSRNPIAPTIDPLKNANREFVNLLGERTQHDHCQVTPQLVMQIQSLQQLDTVQLPAENKLTGLSVEEFRLLIPLVLERVNTTVNSLHDLLQNANTPGFSAKDPDLVRIKNLSTTVQDDLQKLSDMRMNYEWLKNRHAPSSSADDSTDDDPLLINLYMVLNEANWALADSQAILDTNMEALEHQKTVQNAAGGKPMKTSIDDFQMAISSTLPRVKANVKSLNAFLREATTLPTPATNYAVTQMKNLCAAIRNDLQKLSDIKMNYEWKTKHAPLWSAESSTDINPLLRDFYFTVVEANKALTNFTSFLNTADKIVQDDISGSATVGQGFLHGSSWR
uniref:Uncharacterized protein n=1 Tax=Schistocephalus solidus TaxID=70667 RepID=A0A0X3PD93_SCHSO